MWVQVDVIEVYLSLYFARKRTVRGAKIPTLVRSRASMRIEASLRFHDFVSQIPFYGLRSRTPHSRDLHVCTAVEPKIEHADGFVKKHRLSALSSVAQ